MSATDPGRPAAMAKSDRAFRTISEVASDLSVPQHVLRFWETRFAQVRPIKRNGGRRLYRPDHVALLRGIRALLYDDAMTIKGVQKMLREKGVRAVIARGEGGAGLGIQPGLPEDATARLAAIRDRMAGDDARREPELPFDAPPASRADEPGRERVRASIARLEDILARLQA